MKSNGYTMACPPEREDKSLVLALTTLKKDKKKQPHIDRHDCGGIVTLMCRDRFIIHHNVLGTSGSFL